MAERAPAPSPPCRPPESPLGQRLPRPPHHLGRTAIRAATISLGWRLTAAWRFVQADLAARAIQCVARIPALRRLPRRWVVLIERALIRLKGQGLFDPNFYRVQNPDVARALDDPFRHYLHHGWREGRAPNAHFDDGHYRAEAGLARTTPVSPLAHFLAFGRIVGLCPVPGIDLEALGQTNPALGVARLDPYRGLVGGQIDAAAEDRPDLDRVIAALARLRPRPKRTARVDVIVPVYDGRAETLNTLLHVLTARNRIALEVVVVDDAGPEPRLGHALRTLARRGLIRLLAHDENRGFCAAVNAGMALNPGRDVIWLNADTEVYDGWADRLYAAAYSQPKVATVTPLTNNGTICSYPRMNADNPGALEVPWQRVDRIAARVNRGLRVAAPTAVGFATYVRRAAIIALGGLDEAAFGRGYGEENDFSQRAAAKGWTNLIAADVVVRHFGATSFQGARADRVERALKVLDRRYPNYRAEVQAFLAADPVAGARRTIDIARLRALAGAWNVLIVTHSLGGGTQQHVLEEIARLSARGASVFVLTGGTGGPGTAKLAHPGAAALPGLDALDLDGDALWSILGALGLAEVQIHHLIDFPVEAPRLLRDRLRAAGLAYDFVVHDYFAICPRVNLVDASGHYCGEPALSACQRCVARRGSRAGRVDMAAWRARYRALLTDAREVRVPDADVAGRLARYMPDLGAIVVRPHEPPIVAPPAPGRRRPGPVRVAVLGAIGATKGFDAVLGVAGHIQRHGLAMEIAVIGYTQNDAAARAAGIAVTGPYVNDEVAARIEAVDPDLIWIPSVWPETYSYTLSIALRSGRAVATFDIGALGTRLRAAGRGALIPLDLARHPAALYDALRQAARLASGGDARARRGAGRSAEPV